MPTRGAERRAEEWGEWEDEEGEDEEGDEEEEEEEDALKDSVSARLQHQQPVFIPSVNKRGRVTAPRLTELPALLLSCRPPGQAAFHWQATTRDDTEATTHTRIHTHARARTHTTELLLYPCRVQRFFLFCFLATGWNLFKQLKVTTSSRTHVTKSFSHR